MFFFQVGISGTIYDSSQTGRHDRHPGVAGFTVELDNADTGALVATATTDDRGHYHFDVSNGLSLGRFQVHAVLPDGWVQTTADLPVITLTRGDTFETQDSVGVAPA